MSIYVKCEGCGKVLNVPDGCEGRLILCATCGKRMRVPNPAPHSAAEAARPAATPAPPVAAPTPPVAPPIPPAAAPASGGLPEDKAAFFRALVEETEREQREAAAAKAAQAQAEAELTPLSEALAGGESPRAAAETPAPATPAKPPSAAPARGGALDNKDVLFNALAEEAAREQRETDTAKAAETGAEAGEKARSPEALARGKSSAATELRVKAVGDKSGYAVAQGSPPAEFAKPMPRSRKLLGAAAGVLALIILLIIGISFGLSGRKPPAKAQPMDRAAVEMARRRGAPLAQEEPGVNPQTAVLPQPAEPAVPPPEMPPALKEAALALADKALVEVEVAEPAADAAAPQTPILTPNGDLMLDMTNLHIRDKSDADASLQEMRTAIRSAVGESVAAQLREKGLAPVEAGQSAAARPDEPHSRLKVNLPCHAGVGGVQLPRRRGSEQQHALSAGLAAPVPTADAPTA